MSQRKAKVEHALRDVLAELVRREVRDPRVAKAGLLSISKVELNVDLSVANVYVSIIGPGGISAEKAEAAVAALGRAARFLRGPAGRELNLAHPPELRFLLDRSAEMQERIRDVLREDLAKARAAGRENDLRTMPVGTDVRVAPLPAADDEDAPDDEGEPNDEGEDEDEAESGEAVDRDDSGDRPR